MNVLGLTHLAFALSAIAAGGAVVALPKGTPLHRRIGWVYVSCMVGLNATALMIYRLYGGFGPFHVAALLSLATIVAGTFAMLLRRPKRNWLDHHAYWMSWSYVGLLAAAASEVTTRVPDTPFWWMVFAATFVVIGAGMWVINSRVPGILERMRGGR
jgi:uncharacterized membrane protein